MIALGTVNISEKTKKLMMEALDKGVIGQGKHIEEFEEKLAKFFGVKYVIATANGTSADAVALAVAKDQDSQGRNEVIVPALTFIAQINAVYYNHLKPVFVDVDYDYQINPEKIEEKINEKTLAIMPTHLLGRPAAMDKISALAKKYNLFIIEDACEALGSKYKNQLCGTFGHMGCFSFFISHSITTGEGGAITTNDAALAELEWEYVVPHGYPILLGSQERRDQLLSDFPERFGIEARQIFCSIPTQSEAYKFLGERQGDYPIAEDIGKRGLYLPCHQNLSGEDLKTIAGALKKVLKDEPR